MRNEDPYVALSYTWGNPRLHCPILIGERVFHVTLNLAVALEHLQEEEKTLILWVDAICIDQRNEHEKSIQVQRMGEVFSSAALVIVWLGASADKSDLALQEIVKAVDHDSRYDELKQSYQSIQRCHVLLIQPIRALFERPWFKRVWVGQEVALNEEITFVCGQRDIQRYQLLRGHFV
jgi:hypothetical protein